MMSNGANARRSYMYYGRVLKPWRQGLCVARLYSWKLPQKGDARESRASNSTQNLDIGRRSFVVQMSQSPVLTSLCNPLTDFFVWRRLDL
eukprot:6422495-Amphidinium_carterae.1